MVAPSIFDGLPWIQVRNNLPEHDQQASQAAEGRTDSVEHMSTEIRSECTPHLNARANLAGRSAMTGIVKNATKKHTAAPIKHAPKPSNLHRPTRNVRASRRKGYMDSRRR